jgi:hypothetical protein
MSVCEYCGHEIDKDSIARGQEQKCDCGYKAAQSGSGELSSALEIFLKVTGIILLLTGLVLAVFDPHPEHWGDGLTPAVIGAVCYLVSMATHVFTVHPEQ